MAFETHGPGDAPMTGINVTPLVDVMLVLLVVLMVAASGAVSEALPLDLPKATSGQVHTTPLRVAISADGTLAVDGKPTDLAGLARIAERLRSRDEAARATLAADGAARHERVVAVLDALRSSGLTRLAIQVSPTPP